MIRAAVRAVVFRPRFPRVLRRAYVNWSNLEALRERDRRG
jgi:hypothetical protein